MKNPGLLILFLCLSFTVIQAQNISDALRYSQLERSGSARSLGSGLATTAIATDMDVLSTNPAGLAIFRKSVFQISPGVSFFNSDTRLTNGSSSTTGMENKSTFQIPSIGFVSATRPMDKHWKQVNFAMGLNRLANFNRKFEFNGTQSGSIAHDFVERSMGYHPDNLDLFTAGPAYDAYVTAWDEDNNDYYTDLALDDLVNKGQRITESGGIDELSLGVAGNLDEQLLLGISIGIPFLHYERKSVYGETADHPIFRELEYRENLEVVGAGINIKGGLTLRIDRKLHIGLAVHTPTWYNIEEDYDSYVFYDYIYAGNEDIFPEAGPKSADSPLGEFEYAFRTPWRFLGGLGMIIGKLGFLSADIEVTDYSNSKFNFRESIDSGLEFDLNNDIDDNFGTAVSFRMGGELVLESFRIRGGFGVAQSAFEEDDDVLDKSVHAGLGWRSNKFFIDIAYRYADKEYNYSPYTLSKGISPVVNSEYNNHDLVFTTGIVF